MTPIFSTAAITISKKKLAFGIATLAVACGIGGYLGGVKLTQHYATIALVEKGNLYSDILSRRDYLDLMHMAASDAEEKTPEQYRKGGVAARKYREAHPLKSSTIDNSAYKAFIASIGVLYPAGTLVMENLSNTQRGWVMSAIETLIPEVKEMASTTDKKTDALLKELDALKPSAVGDKQPAN